MVWGLSKQNWQLEFQLRILQPTKLPTHISEFSKKLIAYKLLLRNLLKAV